MSGWNLPGVEGADDARRRSHRHSEGLRRALRDQGSGEDEDLREVYEFDSIDAVELLRESSCSSAHPLTYEEKKGAMEIRTFGQILDYVLALAASRPPPDGPAEGPASMSRSGRHHRLRPSPPSAIPARGSSGT